MSSNPFGDAPNPNPYAPPAPAAGAPSPNNPLQVPAIILLVLSSLFVILILTSLPRQFARMRPIDLSTPEGAGALAGTLVPLILMPLMNVAIALGAVSMLRLKSYSSAYLAAILALIPFCSPCVLLGIPFGIWALVLLNRTELKQRFMA
jgi:hypothetical protein